MSEILKDRTSRTLVAFGMYLLYELTNEIIDSNYNLKATSNSKSFILQKQPVEWTNPCHSNIEQDTKYCSFFVNTIINIKKQLKVRPI